MNGKLLSDLSDWRNQVAQQLQSKLPHLSSSESRSRAVRKILLLIFQQRCDQTQARLPPALRRRCMVAKGSLQKMGFQGLIDHSANREMGESLAAAGYRFFGEIYERLHGEEQQSGKKRQGIFYTPKFVVDHIVRQTLPNLLDGRRPAEALKLRVLDPACGAGSFLIGVYEALLKWHLRWYVSHDLGHWLKMRTPPIAVDSGSRNVRLTLAERSRILRECIFGVDADADAVETAKLSLQYLMLADSNGAPPRDSFCNFDANIQCGDSLVDTSFNWHDKFRRVIQSGGFDAVVGNPPYVNIRLINQTYSDVETQFLRNQFRTARGNFDLYILFIERSLDLLKAGGRLGMIVPNKLATLQYAHECRRMLLRETAIDQIVDVSKMKVFASAGIYPYILVCEKSLPKPAHETRIITARQEIDLSGESATCIHQSDLSADGFSIHGSLDVESRVPTKPLGQLVSLHSGTTGFSAQRVAQDLREKSSETDGFEFIVSSNIDRYQISLGRVRFMKRNFHRPVLCETGLTEQKRQLYRGQKIVFAGMTRRLEAALDNRGIALGVQVYAAADFHDDPHFLLALLNSELLSHLFRIRFQAKHLAGGYLAINKGQLSQLPIRTIDRSNPAEVKLHDRLAELAKRIGKNHELLSAPQEKQTQTLRRSIAEADRQIDRIVYKLYNVNADEIRELQRSAA